MINPVLFFLVFFIDRFRELIGMKAVVKEIMKEFNFYWVFYQSVDGLLNGFHQTRLDEMLL